MGDILNSQSFGFSQLLMNYFSAIDGVWTLYGGGGGLSQLKLVNQGASAMVWEAPQSLAVPASGSLQCVISQCQHLCWELGVSGALGWSFFPSSSGPEPLPGKPAETLFLNAPVLREWALRLQPVCLLILSEE